MGLKGPFPDQFLLRLDPDYRQGKKELRTYAEATAEGLAKLEREEQRLFVNELLRREIPYEWHRTDKATRSTVGCPDFIFGINGVTVWMEFKALGGTMSDEQLAFAEKLRKQNQRFHLVFSCKEAIEILDFYAI